MKKVIILVLLFAFSMQVEAKIYAVVVGVEKYDDPKMNLTASVDDAYKLYNFLSKNNKERVVLLTDKQATKQKILRAIHKVFSLAKANDMVVFYFSGHGAKGMFCPTDVKKGYNGLWHHEIKKAFRACKAKSKLIIADACFSGSITAKQSRNTQTNQNNQLKKENVVVFMSSRANQYSIENRRLKAGFFTYFLVKGLKGMADMNRDKKISLFEIYAYVRKYVRKSSKLKQTPIMYGNFNKEAVISTY